MHAPAPFPPRPRARRTVLAAALLGAVLAAGGCITSEQVIVRGHWTLHSVDGVPPAAPGRLDFEADGTVALDTGCNAGGGTYRIDGLRLLTEELRTTLIGCQGAVAAQEQAFLEVLAGPPAFAIDTGTGRLRLTGPTGRVLLFDRAS